MQEAVALENKTDDFHQIRNDFNTVVMKLDLRILQLEQEIERLKGKLKE